VLCICLLSSSSVFTERSDWYLGYTVLLWTSKTAVGLGCADDNELTERDKSFSYFSLICFIWSWAFLLIRIGQALHGSWSDCSVRLPFLSSDPRSDGLWLALFFRAFRTGFLRYFDSLSVSSIHTVYVCECALGLSGNDWTNKAVLFPGHVSVFCLSFALVTKSNRSVCLAIMINSDWEYSSCQKWICVCVLPIVLSKTLFSVLVLSRSYNIERFIIHGFYVYSHTTFNMTRLLIGCDCVERINRLSFG